ncbi:type VI secretion system protein TssA [Amphritea pacifica]|uniref:Type VI secretion system protein TssA n=1 Tax=Amphritea pacifica TaxID=2811233 RepID=A0ABS2W5B3_9GAMM|nr:type VI secretion system protein TssA [Amphritea pacifica]MBN0986911.1 type VI secretion system protein TssA [Amphritea pacifica]
MGIMEQDWAEKLAATPISASQPTGQDIQHEDIYSELDDEIKKGEGIDIQPIDWTRVQVLAETILREHSKDLRVASRLSVALYFRNGFAGLVNGLALLASMLEADYWDSIFPTRRKKPNKLRAAAFEWLVKKLERPFSELQIDPESARDVVLCVEQFKRLELAINQRLADDSPFLFEFKNQLNRFSQDAEYILAEQETKQLADLNDPIAVEPEADPVAVKPREVKEPPAAKPVSQSKSPPAEPIRAQSQSVASTADIEKALTTNNRTVDKICQLLREQRITDPYPYHLLRTSTWMILEKLPATGVLPKIPSESRIQELQGLEQAGNWQALIQECEKSYAGGAIFWLGLHRMVYRALQELGAPDAAAAVAHNVSHLLARFPEFSMNKFANGEGFIDPLTQSWIETELHSSANNEVSDTAEGAAPEWIIAYDDAKKDALKGQFDVGLKRLSDGAAQARGERQRCFWQLQQARLCFDAGHLEVAMSQLKMLHQMLQGRGLERWEPELYLNVIKLLLSGHSQIQTKQKYTKEQQDEVDQLRMALCLMDPLSALAL